MRIAIVPSTTLTYGFEALAAVVVVAVLALVHMAWKSAARTALAALAIGVWLSATWIVAARHMLRFDTRPPSMLIVVVVMLALSFAVGFSRIGARLSTLPLAALVALQAFRLPLELLLDRAWQDGVMPVQMSYSGRNFDIVTGASAIVVALLLATSTSPAFRLRATQLWNVVGILLLVNILAIAILSMPTPLRVFKNEPPNTWIAQAPFVWLPALFVAIAIIGHIVVFRRLREEARALRRSQAAPVIA